MKNLQVHMWLNEARDASGLLAISLVTIMSFENKIYTLGEREGKEQTLTHKNKIQFD